MTYADERVKFSRRPIEIVEMTLDSCSLTYSMSPCTASLSAGSECFNTFRTCQDQANYDKTTTTYRFIKQDERIPAGFTAFPCVENIAYAATRIVPNNIGERASISIRMRDFTHHDRGIDPYVANRSYDPESQGTFWGKFLARNKFYFNRELKIREGFLDDNGAIDLVNNFQDRRYYIERIDGPDRDGYVTIVAKDIIKLVDKVQAPAPSRSSTTTKNIDASESNLFLDANESDFPTGGGYILMEGELAQYTARSGNELSGMTRGVLGTTAAAHNIGTGVQLCLSYTDAKASDVIEDLLTTYGGIDASFIPSSTWESENDSYLGIHTLTHVHATPRPVKDIINSVLESINGYIWWHDVDEEIKFRISRPVSPRDTSITLTDSEHILRDSFSVSEDESRRLSRVLVKYDQINPTDTNDSDNYRKSLTFIRADKESENEYGTTPKSKSIFSDWFSSEGHALELSSRLISLFENTPKEARFRLDAKDNVEPGDIVKIDTKFIQSDTGANEILNFLIIEKKPVSIGAIYEYVALQLGRDNRSAYIGPNSLNDYSSESDENREDYAFISDNDGLMPDLTAGYKIV